MQELKNKLELLIPQYALNKSELDSYKKLCDKENAEIKTLMSQLKETDYSAGGYSAKIIIQNRESLNEDKLLNLLFSKFQKDAEQLGIIKTKYYIDTDALEKALYNGDIPQDIIQDMSKARETKEVVTLKVTKEKKK